MSTGASFCRYCGTRLSPDFSSYNAAPPGPYVRQQDKVLIPYSNPKVFFFCAILFLIISVYSVISCFRTGYTYRPYLIILSLALLTFTVLLVVKMDYHKKRLILAICMFVSAAATIVLYSVLLSSTLRSDGSRVLLDIAYIVRGIGYALLGLVLLSDRLKNGFDERFWCAPSAAAFVSMVLYLIYRSGFNASFSSYLNSVLNHLEVIAAFLFCGVWCRDTSQAIFNAGSFRRYR